MVPVSGTLTHTVPQEVNKLGPHHVNLTQPDVMVFVVLLRTACGISIVDGPTYRCLQEFRFVIRVCCSRLLSLAHTADCLCLNPLSPTHLSLVPYILSCSLCLLRMLTADSPGVDSLDQIRRTCQVRDAAARAPPPLLCRATIPGASDGDHKVKKAQKNNETVGQEN